MTRWVLLTLPAVPWEQIASRIGEHVAYQERLRDAGHLLVGGPFLDEAERSTGAGLTMLTAPTREQAERLAAEDPLVRAGLRTVAVHEWRLAQVGEDVTLGPAS